MSPVNTLLNPPSLKTPPAEMVKLPVTLVDNNPDTRVALSVLETCISEYIKSVGSSN